MNESVRLSLAPLKADLFRVHGRIGSILLLKTLLLHRGFRLLCTLRLCQRLSFGPWRVFLPLAKLLHRFVCHEAAVDLPWRTRIGPGLALTHAWGMVVNGGVQIGANVTLFHGVTLGQADRIAPDGFRTTGFPVLEDEVWVGPHAVIVGGVRVGRGSRIGAGAVVTTDIPPRSLVMGNPAQIKRTDCAPDVMNPCPGVDRL